MAPKINPFNAQYEAEKTKHPLMSMAKNIQRNGWPFKSTLLSRVQWVLNSGSNGLIWLVLSVLSSKNKAVNFYVQTSQRIQQSYIISVPQLRQLVISLSPKRPWFDPTLIHAEFVVDKVTMGQVFLRVLRAFPVTIIPLYSTDIFHLFTTAAI